MFFEPTVNSIINDIIVPVFFSNGLFRFDVTGSDGQIFDTMVVDVTLPQAPTYSPGNMDLYADGAIYFQRHGHRYNPPTAPMVFQQDNHNLQIVLADSSINNVVEMVLAADIIGAIPIPDELTTFLMFPIIPDLYYTFGDRNMTLNIRPVSGTKVGFSGARQTATVHVDTLVDWLVEVDETNTTNAFTSLLDLDLELSMQVNATKHLNLEVKTLALNAFNVTQDNLGGAVIAEQEGILELL